MRVRSIVLPLVVFTTVIFLLQILLGKGFTAAFMLQSADVLYRPWILITSMFLHSGIMHLLFNMYALYMFGPLIEQRIGTKRFVLIYLIAGILSAASFAMAYPSSSALGASGAIMAILGLTIVLLPDIRVLFFFVVPMSMRTAGIIFALLDIFGVFAPVSTGIAHLAHLIGLACSIIYGINLQKKKKKYYRSFSSKHHLDSDDVDEYLRSGR